MFSRAWLPIIVRIQDDVEAFGDRVFNDRSEQRLIAGRKRLRPSIAW